MKKTIFTILCLLIAQCLSAQISLSSSSYTSVVAGTTDTLKDLVISSIPPQTTGAGQTWDFSAVVSSGTEYQHNISAPATIPFSAAQYADTVTDSIGFYDYYSTKMKAVAAPGLLAYGVHINKQVISMESITSNPADTFTILTQDVSYSHPMRNIAFTATYLNHWADTISAVFNCILYSPALSYINAATAVHTTYIIRDTVTGSGVIKLMNSSGIESAVNVLQVKSYVYRIDSTFINGNFITEIEKDYSGLPNGWVTYSCETQYYATNEVTPLADVLYVGYPFVTPQYAKTLSGSSPGTAVPELNEPANINAYPNPVTGHALDVNIPEGSGDWSYELLNATGQRSATGKLQANGTRQQINTAPELPAGIYYLVVTNNGRRISTQKVVIE